MNKSSRFFIPFLLLFLHLTTVSSEAWDGVVITQADFQGLQAFKQGLVDPFNYLQSWNGTGLDACSGAWTGIKCVLGQVIAIQLPWKGLGGHVTEKVGQLTALRKLSLHDNSIGGQIPQSLGFLRELRGVYLFNNRFSGSIPASIGNCLLLQTLDLSNNLFTGSIPSSFSNNTKLYRINLSYNNLSGEVPVGLIGLPSLTFLFLNNNNLSGSIPDSWVEAKKSYQLNTLYLDHNFFSGSVPTSISNLHSLEQLSLNNNQLNGTIPSEIGNLSKLQTLDLSKNIISGELPETIGNISSLFQLNLSGNNITGEIPLSFDNLANLTTFDVSYNNLSGPVPPLLSKKFNSSSFAGNLQLCGYSASTPCPLALSPTVTPTSSSPSKMPTRKLNTKELILTIVGISLLFLLLVFCALLSLVFKKSSDKKTSTDPVKKSTEVAGTTGKGGKASSAKGSDAASSGDTGGKLVHFDGALAFTADDLLCATAEIMGKSTYGTVYKATLEDGSQVAVKRLREKIAKGQKEFETEVNALGKIRHPNLLALRAYYVGPKGEKLLVFDYMPKGSLAAFLHGMLFIFLLFSVYLLQFMSLIKKYCFGFTIGIVVIYIKSCMCFTQLFLTFNQFLIE
jgi:Leucine-rich repeat (LRR) protein